MVVAYALDMYSGVVQLKPQLWVQTAVKKKSWTDDRG
jgi:hypothetical protein